MKSVPYVLFALAGVFTVAAIFTGKVPWWLPVLLITIGLLFTFK